MAINSFTPVTQNDYPRIALILIESLFFGDNKAARRWGVTTRTIRNYRRMLEDSSELSTIFLERRREFEADWAKRIPASIIAGIDFLGEAARKADVTDPEVIRAVSEAVKTLAEVGLAKEIIDARFNQYDRPDGTAGFQVETLPGTTEKINNTDF